MVTLGAVDGAALGVAFQLLLNFPYQCQPLILIGAAVLQALEQGLDLLFDLGDDAVVAFDLQQVIGNLVVSELPCGLGQLYTGQKLWQVCERARSDGQLFLEELVALFIGRTIASDFRVGHAEECLEHVLHLLVKAYVLACIDLSVEHRLPYGGVGTREAQLGVAAVVLWQADLEVTDLELVLVNGHRTLFVCEVLRGEVGEQHIGDHLVDVFLIFGSGLRDVAVVEDEHIIVWA